MSSRLRVGLLIVPLAAALAQLARADADTPSQSHATIRGTGKDVTIVYRGTPSSTRRAEKPAGDDVVAEATRLASKGADEQSLLTYLRNHQSQLPTIVGADEVRRLRRAGASPAVIADLSRLTAVDIGETAEGAMAPAYEGGPGPAGSEMPYPSADMGYPFYGGGYGGGWGGLGFGHRHGGRFGSHHPGFPMRPIVTPHASMRGFGMHSGMQGGMHGGGMRSGGAVHGGIGRTRP